MQRVVVTGMGAVSPLGVSVDTMWSGLKSGKSGITFVDRLDERLPSRIAGIVPDFDVSTAMSVKDARRVDEFIQYGLVAGVEAVKQAGIETPDNPWRYGVAMGSGIGGLSTINKNHDALNGGGPRKLSPFAIPGSVINMLSGNLSIHLGWQGPNFAVSTACATGNHNIGMAFRLIQMGDADVMLVGGAEAASNHLGVGCFAAARALSTRNDEPEKASRPWDVDRDGFVLSDGAGALVLESLEHAQKRGAVILAELVGFGMSGDAYHITSPAQDGAGGLAAMRLAIQNAGLSVEDVDYINAHGTSTPVGDIAEVNAIKALMGKNIEKVRVSSTKSMTGHLLGAAGVIEAIACVKALGDQLAPPTINLDQPDEGCDLNFVAGQAQTASMDVAMSNSFGFGGTNACLVFKRF